MKTLAKALSALFSTSLLLSACVSIPNSEEANLAEGSDYALVGAPHTPSSQWWQNFDFAPIERWRELALQRAPSRALARAKIAQAQALVGTEVSQTSWDSALNANISGQRYSEFGPLPPQLAGSTRASGRIGLDFNKRFDFFDVQANKILTAQAKLAAVRIGEQQSKLELTRAVCLEAINLAEAENGLKWAKLRAQRSTEGWQITLLRIKAGLAADEAAIRPKLEIARSEEWIARTQGAAALARARLRVLTGLSDSELVLKALPEASLGFSDTALPIDLLAHRSDVQIALLRVQSTRFAQTAAEGAFYPNIDLNLFAALSAIGLPRLLDLDAANLGVTPALHLPIFQRAQLHARLHGAQSDMAFAAAEYSDAVQNSAEELASAIATHNMLSAQLSAIKVLTAQSKLALNMAELQASRGLTNRLPVITAMGPVLDAEMQSLALNASLWRSDLALFMALGGGYTSDATAPDVASKTQTNTANSNADGAVK